MKTAVFLGAGASKAFGYPLTTELLPRIIERSWSDSLFNKTNTDEENQADRHWFVKRLAQLLPGLQDLIADGGKLPANLGVSVTDLLTLVDRALQHAEARMNMPPEDFGRFRNLLERAIYEALMQDNERKNPECQETLEAFAEWIASRAGSVGLLTTNYDTAVDRRLSSRVLGKAPDQSSLTIGKKFDFGFSWRRVSSGELIPRPLAPRYQLLKLHGSVNWLRCSLCGQIYVNTATTVGSNAFARKLDKWNTCHCNDSVRLRLHLVTPSFVRQTNDAQLLSIWQAALETLRTADHWVLVGYSLPAEDIAIRSLFLRAWDGHATKPEVTVVQVKNEATERVYRAFFPRSKLTYFDQGLQAFLAKASP